MWFEYLYVKKKICIFKLNIFHRFHIQNMNRHTHWQSASFLLKTRKALQKQPQLKGSFSARSRTLIHIVLF